MNGPEGGCLPCKVGVVRSTCSPLKGFTDGIMLLGVYKGQPVKVVKPKIKALMLADGTAIVYSEPSSASDVAERGRVRGGAHRPVVPRVRRGRVEGAGGEVPGPDEHVPRGVPPRLRAHPGVAAAV
eukprot:CAMPEP_0197591902 /NCGR_PEP_ID=MMETSP1326-20131121/14052_1 /TAXON_ID=1155430 /ORGANISM="Genus nov. species nov., Strain RCC2288" /LENGTH=125 /DNA_ID=CAMNT_0043157481 /DNA_START=23 /DNA_END=397 /DNA_ORIENTATION=+